MFSNKIKLRGYEILILIASSDKEKYLYIFCNLDKNFFC